MAGLLAVAHRPVAGTGALTLRVIPITAAAVDTLARMGRAARIRNARRRATVGPFAVAHRRAAGTDALIRPVIQTTAAVVNILAHMGQAA